MKDKKKKKKSKKHRDSDSSDEEDEAKKKEKLKKVGGLFLFNATHTHLYRHVLNASVLYIAYCEGKQCVFLCRH